MSDSKEYILRKPLKPHEIQYWDFVFNKASFPNAFREVDREQLKQQLATEVEHGIIRALNNYADEAGIEQDLYYESVFVDDVAERVLSLCFGEEPQ